MSFRSFRLSRGFWRDGARSRERERLVRRRLRRPRVTTTITRIFISRLILTITFFHNFFPLIPRNSFIPKVIGIGIFCLVFMKLPSFGWTASYVLWRSMLVLTERLSVFGLDERAAVSMKLTLSDWRSVGWIWITGITAVRRRISRKHSLHYYRAAWSWLQWV